jgi:hypothetical protein
MTRMCYNVLAMHGTIKVPQVTVVEIKYTTRGQLLQVSVFLTFSDAAKVL